MRKYYSKWLLYIAFFPLAYFIYSLNFTGPTYLADEIGYLSKAAYLGGRLIDGASSYHGGYSLFIFPLFYIFDSPERVWIGVILINSLLWYGSFLVLNYLITLFDNNISDANRFIVLLVSALFPSWATMSGYAFTTSAFCFVFLFTVFCLSLIREINWTSVIPHSLAVGFLYWIHPTGLAVAVASIVTLVIVFMLRRRYAHLVTHVLLVLVMIILYKFWFHPFLNEAMTPRGYPIYEHYSEMGISLKNLLTDNFFFNLTIKFIGQIYYAVIASIGIVLFALYYLSRRIWGSKYYEASNGGVGNRNIISMSIFIMISFFLVVILGSLFLTFCERNHKIQVYNLIYGRYLEGVLLPLIALGIVYFCQLKIKQRILFGIAISCLVICGGLLIDAKMVDVVDNNIINTISFWPQYLSSINFFSKPGYIGAIIIFITCSLGKNALLPVMLLSSAIVTPKQFVHHKKSCFPKPSLCDVVQAISVPGSCVGFDDVVPPDYNAPFKSIVENRAKYEGKHNDGFTLQQLEKYNLYSYYLFNYRFRRVDINDWRRHCDGPLLTFNPKQIDSNVGEHVIAREDITGLFLVTKAGQPGIAMTDDLHSRDDISFPRFIGDHGFLSGYRMNARALYPFSLVGRLKDDILVADKKEGYLFYGPYRHFSAGSYKVVLYGLVSGSHSAFLDVVSQQGKIIHLKQKICLNDCNKDSFVFPFQLMTSVKDLEIRMYVGKHDQLSVKGYEVEKVF